MATRSTSRFALLFPASLARAVTLAALAATLCAAPQAFAQGKGESVKFQDYPGTGNMLIRVAKSQGYCEKYGIKCELQMIPAPTLGAQAMLAKSIDSFLGPAAVLNSAIQKGGKMKMVVGGASVNTSILTAGNTVDTPNATKGFPAFMQDLKGKKIGVPGRGTAAEMYTVWMLQKAGMKAEDVTYVAVGAPNTAYGALMSKQVDFLMLFEPAGTMCDVLKTCKRIYTASRDTQPAEMFALNGGGSGLVFTQDYIDKNPHVIDAVIKAVKDAETFIHAPGNYDEVLKIALSYFRFDMPKGDEVLAQVLRDSIRSKAYSSTISRKAIQADLDLLLSIKLIDKMPQVSDLVLDKAPGV
jgi:NitT/TauT family transport system substrate-binding protein